MRKHPAANPRYFLIVTLTFLAMVSACAGKGDQSVQSTDPDLLLRQMSSSLAQAKQLTFKVTRRMDAALIEGRDVPETAEIEVSIARPNKFMAKSASTGDVRRFYFDGQNLSLFDETMQLYATVPVTGTIDELVAKIDQKYGFVPPLADFAINDPYAKLSQQIQSKSYKGTESIGGVNCHHLALTGETADAELWFSTSDSLPRKLIATFKDREGKPQLQIDFRDWNVNPQLDNKLFAFVAPKDAEKIEMVSVDEMNEKQKAEKAPEK